MKDKLKIKIAVIGGGAAGLTAAIKCAEKFGGKNVIILERQINIGRKLLSTGNGRCNISNKNLSPEHYNGDKNIINHVLSDFSYKASKRFFGNMGILFREDSEGRAYPYSNQAATVLGCMLLQLDRLEVKRLCSFKINSIIKNENYFEISAVNMTIYAEYVIFACGSAAYPSLGSNTSGFELLQNFGIPQPRLLPALAPIETIEKYRILKGVRAKGIVSMYADNELITEKQGEIQFTDKWLSGICVFDISRTVNEYLIYKKSHDIKLCIDLMPEYTESDLWVYLKKCKVLFSNEKAAELLTGALNKNLARTAATYAGIQDKLCRTLSGNDMQKLITAVKAFTFTPVYSENFNSSQVCAGGYGSDTVNPETLMAKKVDRLFICGEMLDADGECGGYNLHFAFGSAMKPAKYIK